ncbi:BF3164 family lipoprotein [Phocaeicola faecalis]|uniref:BF3164 family lipoprotein n=1 Tax=Phocaeicola faecalis TaxID=2786956 RepID=UPI001F3A50E3|nr:BF3164 family lipoprotein [Phocaeicola faecalis]
MNPILLFIFIFFLTSSCARDTEKSSNIVQKYIPDSCTTISLEKKELPIDLLYPTDIQVVDTFLLVSQHHNENIIQAYSTLSLKHLGSFLKKGSGPNEVMAFGLIAQSYTESGNPKLIIQSYPNYLGILNIKRSLESSQAVFDKQYKFEPHLGKELFLASHSVYVLDSVNLMMTKDPVRSGIKNDINFFWEFYNTDKDIITRQLKYEDFPYMDTFLKESYRSLNPDRSKVALFYRFFDMVSIADLKSGKVVQIIPNGKSINSSIVRDINSRCLYYKMGKCTDDYILGLYAGGLSVLKENDPRSNENCSLRIYNWDGNLLYNYPFGNNIRMFTVDESQRFLYAVTDSDSIIRYDLKDVSISESHKYQE